MSDIDAGGRSQLDAEPSSALGDGARSPLVPGGPALVRWTTGDTRFVAVSMLLLVVGIAITVGTYLMAAPGGVFVLAWGPIVFGGIQFLRGVFQAATE